MTRSALLIPALLTMLFSPSSLAHEEDWFIGGSLHGGTLEEWNRAPYANRLATSADWALASKNVEKVVRTSGDIDALKPFAMELLRCVDRVSHSEGIIDETQAIQVASACMAHMGW